MAEAYLVGLADEVRPILEATIAWMEAQPEPERHVFAGENEHSGAWPFALYEWRQALGLCKWLSRGDRAEREFAGALDAEWQAWEQVSSKQAAAWRADRRSMLGQYLAMALAANAPTLGLKFYEASGVKRPSGRSGPARGFGQWACRRLAEGGARDAAFIERGAEMLTKTLLQKVSWEADKTEPALWLKAIYFDSGVVRTPEQAIAKAYDSMPGIERPDFVPA